MPDGPCRRRRSVALHHLPARPEVESFAAARCGAGCCAGRCVGGGDGLHRRRNDARRWRGHDGIAGRCDRRRHRVGRRRRRRQRNAATGRCWWRRRRCSLVTRLVAGAWFRHGAILPGLVGPTGHPVVGSAARSRGGSVDVGGLLGDLGTNFVHVDRLHLTDQIVERVAGQRPGLREQLDAVAERSSTSGSNGSRGHPRSPARPPCRSWRR